MGWEYNLFWGFFAVCWFVITPIGVFVLPYFVDETVCLWVTAFGVFTPLILLFGFVIISEVQRKRVYKEEYGTVIQADEEKAEETHDGEPKFTLAIRLDSGITIQDNTFAFFRDPVSYLKFRVGDRIIVKYHMRTKKIEQVMLSHVELDDQMEELENQLGRGAITQEEYEQKKKKLLEKYQAR